MNLKTSFLRFFPRRLLVGSLFTASGLVTTANAAVSLANGYYSENFNGTLDANAWTVSTHVSGGNPTNSVGVRSYTDGGRSTVKHGTTAGNGIVTGTPPPGVNVDDTFAAIKTPGSYGAYGFSGSWLVNTGDNGLGNGDLDSIRTATLSFHSLGAHTKIDSISFLLAAGDSIDNNEGIFEIFVDDTLIFRRDFETGGTLRGSGFLTGYENVGTGITTFVTSANLRGDGFYREIWNANATTTDQRSAESWTLDSAYSVSLQNIAHTSDTLTIRFVWRGFNSDQGDEFLAIDNLVINVPEPGRMGLLLPAFAALILHRPRRRQVPL
jgi:hypothetical protein